tara:strand:- start:6922 stop:8052 length:1131 start_codon:yes stop_codon:yes gene_type:complete
MADPLREYVEPSSIFADRKKLPPQKFGDDNYENMVNYIMRNGTIGQNEYAEAGLNDLSLRQRTADGVASAAEYLGMKPYEARKFAGNVTGDMNQGIAEGMGLSDFTPAGLVFGANEAYRDFKIADSPTDYIAPAVGGAFAAAEAFPLTKAMTRPALAWLKSITSKAAVPRSEKVDAIVAADKVQDNLDEMITGEVPTQQYDDDVELGNLPDPTTVNRREVMGGLSALGVTAAAPSLIKIAGDVPAPVKAAVKKLPPPPGIGALSKSVSKTRSFNEISDYIEGEYSISPQEAFDQALEEEMVYDEVMDSLNEEADNIQNWLDGDEAGLDNYFEKFGTQAPTGYEDDAYYVIEELMGEPYFMTKAEVGEWFKKEGIID